MKRLIKSLAQHATAALIPPTWQLRRDPRLLILMYHRVLPAQHPDRRFEQPGMYVSPETLAMHLQVLKRHFTVVHLDDWIVQVQAGTQLPGNACAITFDDGWLDNYQYAYPVLKQAGCPATIYLVSDLVGTQYEFWPNRLVRILSTKASGLNAPDWLTALIARHRVAAPMAPRAQLERIDAVVCECKAQRSDAEMIALVEQLERSAGVERSAEQRRDLMDWNEIAAMGADDQIRFGSHSRRHTRLTDTLTEAATADEVGRSAEIIEQHLGKRPRTFCYPNGDHSAAAMSAARKHYLAAVTTEHGWNTKGSNLFTLRRVGVHDDASARRPQFLARLAGVG